MTLVLRGITCLETRVWRHININLADLLFSVSEAMDLSNPSLVDHQIRTAFVTSQMARAGRLEHGAAERLFTAALLHDIGAMSPEEKVGLHDDEDVHAEAHCQRGGRLFGDAFWLAPSAPIVEWHHTAMGRHRDCGRSIGETNVLAAQMLMLADIVERMIRRQEFILHQVPRIRERIHRLSGPVLHPDVVILFNEVSDREDFWLELVSKDLSRRLRERSLLRSIELDFEAARAVVSVFKDITDFRSRFTATHSTGVAVCARGIAQQLSFSGKDLQQIELAGYLHDIGKLVIPNAILCKPDALTVEEYAVIRQHPYYTHRILSRVRGFEQIAEWAAFHHERLDGSGYPGRVDRHMLDLGAKVIAVADVATAMAEQRPYRGPGTQDTVLAVLRDMAASGQLESGIVQVLADHYTDIMGDMKVAQAADEARFQARHAA